MTSFHLGRHSSNMSSQRKSNRPKIPTDFYRPSDNGQSDNGQFDCFIKGLEKKYVMGNGDTCRKKKRSNKAGQFFDDQAIEVSVKARPKRKKKKRKHIDKDLTYNKREQFREHLESKYIGDPKEIGISRAYENKEKEMSKGFVVSESKKRNRFIEEDGYDSDTYSKINAVEYEISSHDMATKEYWSDSDREILNEAKTNAAKYEKELHGDEKLNRRLDHEQNELVKDRAYARMTKEKEARDKLRADLINKVSSVKVNNSVSNSINYSDSSQSHTMNNSNNNNSSGNHCTTTSNTNTGNNYSTNNSTTNIYHFQYAPGMPHVTGSGIPVSYPQQHMSLGLMNQPFQQYHTSSSPRQYMNIGGPFNQLQQYHMAPQVHRLYQNLSLDELYRLYEVECPSERDACWLTHYKEAHSRFITEGNRLNSSYNGGALAYISTWVLKQRNYSHVRVKKALMDILTMYLNNRSA